MNLAVEGDAQKFGEADTRAKLIDPAIHAREWHEDMIRREETAGAIEIVGGKARRRSRGHVDYTLRLKPTNDVQSVAVALIEAKKASLPPGHGLDQGKAYAHSKRLNVPFVFSSNGYQFVEYDNFTGQTSAPRPMAEFPSPDALRVRYEQGMGFALDDDAAKPLLTPYHNGEGARRYYQDAAIRAVLEKIARRDRSHESKRALLTLATGAGKTFIAVNLLKRIADAGQLKRALFVCDRDELRTQALGAFQNVFGSDVAEVKRNSDGTNNARNARVHIATYQTLGIDRADADSSFLSEHYPPGHFSHVIIDECHRSAWGKWSEVLTRNPEAVQVGLTATPRTIEVGPGGVAQRDAAISADNQAYFGEPVYEYDMAQAMEDGYLAVCEIQRGRVDLDDTGINIDDIMARNPRDAVTGRVVTREQLRARYENTSYENRVLLPDRVLAMCRDLFDYLCAHGGPEQKTIVFCARDRHAEDVAITLNNLYAQWCTDNNRERLDYYAFKCTAASSGNDQLPDLRGGARHHFIAATVDLLTTGVDVPNVRNIVFFKYVRSPISFYQMLGRGTRLDPASGKLMFRVYDYTGATHLFGAGFVTKPPSVREGEGPVDPPPPEPTIVVDGFDVAITDAGRFVVVQDNGQAKPIPVEEYKDRLASQLVAEAPTLDEFRRRWTHPAERRTLLDRLVNAGTPPSVLQILEEMNDYDLYDVLADLGFGLAPRTRTDRSLAFTYKHEDWLIGLPEQTAAAIRAIVGQFSQGGTDSLENRMIFQTPEVMAAGGIKALQLDGAQPAALLQETKERMFSV